uniref:Uncharacterized protein n=1 Tax=Parascaris univalens TaxID=6257 RepID=A0A915AV41_PARUN
MFFRSLRWLSSTRSALVSEPYVLDMDEKYFSQHFAHLYDCEGTIQRFYKCSDGKWLFIGVNNKHSLFSLFKQLQIDSQLEHDTSDEKISATLAERLKQQPQSYWTNKITDLCVTAI